MPHLIIVLLVLAGVIWGSKFLKGFAPGSQEKLMRQGGGFVALGLGLFLLLRGQTEVALGLGGFGLYLLGVSGTPHWSGLFKKGAGPSSDLRSAMVELDPDFRSGQVLAGAYEGKKLAELTRSQCEALYQTALREDPEGARLLEAHLDRRFPGWRGADQFNADARSRARGPGKMSQDEAYEVLGLAKGASDEAIAGAHRSLMKKLHPDQGGTTSLAARVNEARDVLTRRHL